MTSEGDRHESLVVDTSFLYPASSTKTEKHKRRSLSIGEKLSIIEDIESGKSRNIVADERDLPRSTVFTIWTTRNKIRSANSVHGRHDGCKRVRPSGYDEVDQALYRWWLHAKENNTAISSSLLSDKARSFAKSLGVQFKNTNSWIDRFKLRHGIRLKALGTLEIESPQNRRDDFVKRLPHLTNGKDFRNIYCVNLIGLFHHVLPDENQVFGTANSNVSCDKRLTLLLGANMDGSDPLPPLVIGNSEAVSDFESVESLSISYSYNKLSCVTTEIWTKWIGAFDKRMHALDRDVILFSDGCASQFTVKNLKAVTVKFVPRSETAFMPVKQGILQCFKAWYRKLVMRDMVESINDGVEYHFDLLSSFHFIRKAWEHVSQDCIINAFQIAGWTWDDGYGKNVFSSDNLPNLSFEVFKLNISESVFVEINKVEEEMKIQQDVTDAVIVNSVSSQNGIFLDNVVENGEDEISNVKQNTSSIPSESRLSNNDKPTIDEAREAIKKLNAFIDSVENNSKPPAAAALKRPGPRERRMRKKMVEKGRVMSLNPKKGVFEMTLTRIVKTEDDDNNGV